MSTHLPDRPRAPHRMLFVFDDLLIGIPRVVIALIGLAFVSACVGLVASVRLAGRAGADAGR
jgi:hypothetical protein